MATSQLLSARGERVIFAALLVLAAFLNIFRLSDAGYGNLYYAATVKSMLTSWHAFFFASFDAGGFVTVDKPPLGFWIQAASAKLFGFSGLSLLLPEAIAGVCAVALLYALVRRAFGPGAALLAAAVLAVTPVAVAVNRNNTIDSLLILTLLGAVWCVLRAIERGSLPWLLAGALLVGLGFNIKMLQAYLVVPALYLAYLVGARISWPRRISHLTLATVVLLVVSLAWAVAVELTPAAQRPYIGSSDTNSVINLILDYNGLHRFLPGDWGSLLGSGVSSASDAGSGGGPFGSAGSTGGMGGFGVGETGEQGPLRLLNSQLAGQIGWLLPLSIVGLAAAWWQTPARWTLDRQRINLVLWGTWLITAVGFFSMANWFHRYYLVMLAPPLAALVGVGCVAIWRDYLRLGWRGWLLPLSVLGTVAVQIAILRDYPDWSARLTPWLALLGGAATLGLVLARWRPNLLDGRPRRAARALAAVALVAILAAPATWAAITAWEGSADMLPVGGPAGSYGGIGFPGADFAAASAEAGQSSEGLLTANSPEERRHDGGPHGEADAKLLAFLQANRQGERFQFATTDANTAAPYILATGEAVAALGGFSGGDPILTTDELTTMIANGEVRYFYVPSVDEEASSTTEGPPGRGFSDNANVRWINDHCAAVPSAEWQGATDDSGAPFGRDQVLFDCTDV